MAGAGDAKPVGVHIAARGIAETAGGGEVGGLVRTAFGERHDVIERCAAPAFAGAVHGEVAPAAPALLRGDKRQAKLSAIQAMSHRLIGKPASTFPDDAIAKDARAACGLSPDGTSNGAPERRMT